MDPAAQPEAPARSTPLYWAALAVLIGLAILRSAIATRLDGFTIDEPYHVVAGVSYVRTADFRLNPEHPPLMKLWAGAVLSAGRFRLPPFRPLADKNDERHFTDAAVFLQNDPDAVQSRTRAALFAFNGLLLALLAEAIRRNFGPTLALFALAFLVIDPTVAAHLPVAMTDLPIGLLATTAMLFALAAFRTWRTADLVLAGVTLGLALGAKHSALIVALVVGVGGLLAALRSGGFVLRRLAAVASVLAIAAVVLWGLYGFRFAESPSGGATSSFNRPLEAKVQDLRSPLLRTALQTLEQARLLPRAYLWGLADTLRAGVEGRDSAVLFFGKTYEDGARPPFYYFPGIIAVKLPLGLLALSAAGLVIALRRKFPAEWSGPLVGALLLALAFLAALAGARSEYAGVRHALPVYPALALLAGMACVTALRSRSTALRLFVALALGLALASALPALRPWEYHNALAGGTENAYRHFANEGLDLGQRKREAVAYYRSRLAPAGVVPYWFYSDSWGPPQEFALHYRLRGHWGTSPDGAGDESPTMTGVVLVNARNLFPTRLYDEGAFRRARPVARFGNLLVLEGSFDRPWYRASNLLAQAYDNLMSSSRDEAKAERQLRESLELDPSNYGTAIELGNLAAQRGDRAEAIRAFTIAKANTPAGNSLIPILARHLERLAREAPESLPEVRDPFSE